MKRQNTTSNQQRKSLMLKDLVLIGIFDVIYLSIISACACMGIVPIMFLIFPTIAAIIAGPLVLLFMAKEQKAFAFLIFGFIPPTILFLLGYTYFVLVIGIITTLLAEVLRKIGNYSSFTWNMLAYAVYSLWMPGILSQMFFVREQFLERCQSMGGAYIAQLVQILTWQSMILVAIGAMVGAIIGALIGKKLLKKHFVKAGIVA